MIKKFFIYLIILTLPITIILWFYFTIILSAETIRFFIKKEIPPYDPEKCYRAGCYVNYENYDWANEYFYENDIAKTKVFSGHTLYKEANFNGKYLNIEGPDNLRKTKMPKKIKSNKQINVFGGSVAWGFGTKDDLTLSSLLAKEFNLKSTNYAHNAWTSTQSLIELNRILSQGKNLDYVIFLSGTNDAIELCNKKNPRENLNTLTLDSYQKKIYGENYKATTFNHFFSTFDQFFTFLRYKLIKNYHLKKSKKKAETQLHDCHSDSEKLNAATNYTINNWLSAKKLVEEQGGKFYLILQPNPFYDDTPMDHIGDIFKTALRDPSYKKSFELFFDTISKKLNNEYFFLDLKSLFKNLNNPIYIDWAGHFSPEGYQYIIEEFRKKFSKDFDL